MIENSEILEINTGIRRQSLDRLIRRQNHRHRIHRCRIGCSMGYLNHMNHMHHISSHTPTRNRSSKLDQRNQHHRWLQHMGLYRIHYSLLDIVVPILGLFQHITLIQ